MFNTSDTSERLAQVACTYTRKPQMSCERKLEAANEADCEVANIQGEVHAATSLPLVLVFLVADFARVPTPAEKFAEKVRDPLGAELAAGTGTLDGKAHWLWDGFSELAGTTVLQEMVKRLSEPIQEPDNSDEYYHDLLTGWLKYNSPPPASPGWYPGQFTLERLLGLLDFNTDYPLYDGKEERYIELRGNKTFNVWFKGFLDVRCGGILNENVGQMTFLHETPEHAVDPPRVPRFVAISGNTIMELWLRFKKEDGRDYLFGSDSDSD